ncbi:MAG: LapA family protein [Xenococcaceae cyanobacterium]
MIIFDFLIIFLTCLALALFSLQNTQEITLKIVPELEIQISLAVALIVSMGLGALLSGLYLTWIKVRNYFQFWGKSRQLKDREKQIQKLKEDIETRQAELELLRQEKTLSESEVA